MSELAQPGAMERWLFWLRFVGAALLVAGIALSMAAAYLSARLEGIRTAEIDSLRAQVSLLRSARPTAEMPEARREQAPVGRQIGPAQHDQIVAALKDATGTKVNVVSVPEYEPGSYAHQIIKTLRAAGIEVRVIYFPDSESIPRGLRAYWSEQAESTAKRIIDAFEHAGISFKAKRGAPSGGAVVEIHVGRAEIALPSTPTQ